MFLCLNACKVETICEMGSFVVKLIILLIIIDEFLLKILNYLYDLESLC